MPVSLHATRCRRCGHLAVPAQHLGCERCGAHGDDLATVELAGRGAVLAAVTVHVVAGSEPTRPGVVGAVQLDEGPVVRARLETNLPAGTVVHTTAGGAEPVFGQGPAT